MHLQKANKQITSMNRYIRPMLAAVFVTAAACSPTDELPADTITDESELSISVNTQSPTKGMITERVLPDGSELCIGIFNPDGSNYMGKNYGHLYFKAENDPGTQIWKPSGQVLLGESEGVLYAYYPYSMYSGGDIRHIFVEADSYTQDDFMYAGPYTGLNMDNKHVDITLKHALAAIKLTTRRGSYEGAGAIRSIGLGGYCGGYQGYFDVTQGKFTEVSTGGIIYPTTSFNLSDGPNEQYIMLIPTGEPGDLMIRMTIDEVYYTKTIPNFMIEQGKVTNLNLSVDKGKLTINSVTLSEWSVTARGEATALADYKVTLTGDQEGISIGTVIDDNGKVTITAVPYISKEASVNPVTFEGTATFSQEVNENSGVRTIVIEDLESNVSVIFDGYTI